MQNLLREFRTLYEERLARLENAPQNQHNLKARNEVYQHYVHVMGFNLKHSHVIVIQKVLNFEWKIILSVE